MLSPDFYASISMSNKIQVGVPKIKPAAFSEVQPEMFRGSCFMQITEITSFPAKLFQTISPFVVFSLSLLKLNFTF